MGRSSLASARVKSPLHRPAGAWLCALTLLALPAAVAPALQTIDRAELSHDTGAHCAAVPLPAAA